jgi:hypothetical protein
VSVHIRVGSREERKGEVEDLRDVKDSHVDSSTESRESSPRQVEAFVVLTSWTTVRSDFSKSSSEMEVRGGRRRR